MGRTNRFLLLVLSCGALGIVFGGTASRAEMNQCLTAASPTNECLTQDPVVETFEGMSMGLVAGAGAAAGAGWQLLNKDK